MLLPVALWLACRRFRFAPWLGGWAGFCMVANGIYLAAGWLESAGDAADLVQLGMPVWLLIASGTVAVGLGPWLWHGLIERSRGESRRQTTQF